ncbi:hypothetical protein WJX73_006487 [Symbiochloris irregularis]|uniref:Damage-control phosphatase ARMT1-like metal-binding domain-containing protein n=1 Tax=Symbiochloris irregularis TaxID=706552 RepID=A0AAW1NXN5_9CHLO
MGRTLEPLTLLEDVQEYQRAGCNTFDYRPTTSSDGPVRSDWLKMYQNTIKGFQDQAAKDHRHDRPEQAADRFATEYAALLESFADSGPSDVELTTVSLCRLREEGLRRQGFGDVYKQVKFQENVKALGLLSEVLRELDAISDLQPRLDAALRGVFAGNVFDLGAPATTAAFASGEMTFAKTRKGLLPRPWTRDDIDHIIHRWQEQPHSKALIFVDNAGSDIILGILPLARELIKLGTSVVLAANDVASINDITVQELQPLLQQAAQLDTTIGAAISLGRLVAIPSGNDLPVIDLSRVSPEVNAAAEGTDLVIMEGMGRGIETNLNARFICDSLNLGMVKHPEVAAALGARMYDIVCQYRRPAGGNVSA